MSCPGAIALVNLMTPFSDNISVVTHGDSSTAKSTTGTGQSVRGDCGVRNAGPSLQMFGAWPECVFRMRRAPAQQVHAILPECSGAMAYCGLTYRYHHLVRCGHVFQTHHFYDQNEHDNDDFRKGPSLLTKESGDGQNICIKFRVAHMDRHSMDACCNLGAQHRRCSQ